MTSSDTPLEPSPDEALDAQQAARVAAEARELIERGDFRRARRALAAFEAADLPPGLSDELADELARLEAAVGIDHVAIGLSLAGALLLLIIVVLLAL